MSPGKEVREPSSLSPYILPPPPLSPQTCCSHVLNINYNCYSLQSRKAPGTNTIVHFLALAQGIVGSGRGGGLGLTGVQKGGGQEVEGTQTQVGWDGG